ncbi:MAG: hypothetical protein QM831_21985 [Kofleriaceae bacterium]
MIASPVNDRTCLDAATKKICLEIERGNPALFDRAHQFTNLDDLTAWFRTLPQRDDEGDAHDGPKVHGCRPPQRLRLDASDPNCFERSLRFIGIAELIDPNHVYRLKTISTPVGLHTFPLCDGVPVVLDPEGVRNTPRGAESSDIDTRRRRILRLLGADETKGIRGDLTRARRARELGHDVWVNGEPIDEAIATYEQTCDRYQTMLDELDEIDDSSTNEPTACTRNLGGTPLVFTPTQAIDWIADLARTWTEALPRMQPHINRGHRAMRAVVLLLPIDLVDVQAIALVLALAAREARSLGLPAVKVVHSTARAIDQLAQNIRNANPFASLAVGLLNDKDVQSWLGAVTRVGAHILGGAGVEVVKSQLAGLGVTQPVMSALEKDLNSEGLSLGALSKPSPMPGSLDAMTPQALAGRWIAQKL